MAQDNRPRPAFVEEAEEALERIRRELEESRQRRKQASEAFDAFLRSFGPRNGREPRPVDPRSWDVRPSEPPVATRPIPEPPIVVREPVNRAEPPLEPLRSWEAEAPPRPDAPPVIGPPVPAAGWQSTAAGHSPSIVLPKTDSSPPDTVPPPLIPAAPVSSATPAIDPPAATAQPPEAESTLEALLAIDRSTWPFSPPRSPGAASQPVFDAPSSPISTPPIIPAAPSTTAATGAEAEAAAVTSRPAEPEIPEPTTPLRLNQEIGAPDSLSPEPREIGQARQIAESSRIAEPAQIVEPPRMDSRARIAAIVASLRQSLQRGKLRREHAAAAVGAVVVLAALLLWLMRSSPDETASSGQRGGPTAAAPAPAPSAQPAAPQAAPPPGLQLELRTLRLVWMRVIVDGERAIEREIPAGQTIPINGQKTVVIRAGDAGAVRVAINGEDQGLLGTDGFPATRTFTRPQ
jgi:hypothetical protein